MEDITEGAGWQGAGVRGLWRDLARTATKASTDSPTAIMYYHPVVHDQSQVCL